MKGRWVDRGIDKTGIAWDSSPIFSQRMDPIVNRHKNAKFVSNTLASERRNTVDPAKLYSEKYREGGGMIAAYSAVDSPFLT